MLKGKKKKLWAFVTVLVAFLKQALGINRLNYASAMNVQLEIFDQHEVFGYQLNK